MAPCRKVLIVDDEPSIRELLSEMLSQAGFQCRTSPNADEALQILKERDIALVISDLRMPGKDGMALLREIQESYPEVCVILLTGYGTVETAVEAMKMGAYDFATKPTDLHRIPALAERALEDMDLRRALTRMQTGVRSGCRFDDLIGKSESMQHIYDVVGRVAQTEATVLIQGESGTGKDLLAHAIHGNSHRSQAPFIKVDCGALAETLLESELFGHEKGAFTGAFRQNIGRFELADGGTLFLDEIANMSLLLQQRLLRVLQERQFERVGGNKTMSVDVRILAATSRDLAEAVRSGHFREDLFYRLDVVPILLPPLRKRSEDIPALAAHFLNKYAERNRRNIKGISSEAFHLLMNHDWPGNVRELENTIEYAVVMCRAESIQTIDLPPRIRSEQEKQQTSHRLSENEKLLIAEVLETTEGNIRRAAQLLDISRTTLYSKIKKHGLRQIPP